MQNINSSSPLIPEIALKYEPSPAEMINYLKGVLTRRIFHCQSESSFTEKEQKSLIEIDNYLQKVKLNLPIWWTRSNTLRHLQGCEYKIKDTFDSIKYAIQFMSNTLTVPKPLPDDINEIFNSGFMYIHGVDNRFRPLVFVNPARYNASKYQFHIYERAIALFVQYITDNCFIEGKIENWDMIVDLSEMSLLSIPYDLKELHKSVKNVYRCRLFKLYVLNLSSWLLFTWKIAKVFMGVTIEAKVAMADYDGGKYNKIYELMNREQVEMKYGGTALNLTQGNYFPPQFLPGQHAIFLNNEEDQNLKNKLIRKEQVSNYLEIE